MVKNIRGDLRKYRPRSSQTSQKRRTTSEIVNNDFIPAGVETPIQTHHQSSPPEPTPSTIPFFDLNDKIAEMDRIVEEEEKRLSSITNPHSMISPYPRTVYFSKCGHKAISYINNIKLDTWYWCNECVLYRKIGEVVY